MAEPEKEKEEKKKSAVLIENLHTFEADKDYSVPEWSSLPKKKIIKGGQFIEEKAIKDKPFFLIGKLPDLCDIVLEHTSISRKHAIIQHHQNGEVYLYDLGSTHGSFVNKKRVEARRFVLLKPGAFIKFGGSTRDFILQLDEPTEAEMAEKNAAQEKTDAIFMKNSAHSNSSNKASSKEESDQSSLKEIYKGMLEKKYGIFGKRQNDFSQEALIKYGGEEGIAWGIEDDEAVYRQQNEDEMSLEPELLRELPNLTEKQREKIDNYEQRLEKYTNLDNELQELTKKERAEYGLPEKLKVKKENIQTKLNELGNQLEILEDNLRFALFNEEKERKDARKWLDDDADDEFYDRTLATKKVKTDKNSGPAPVVTENYQTLKQKLEDLIVSRQKLNMEYFQYTTKGGKEINDGEVQEEEDALDAFMKKNENIREEEIKSNILDKIKSASEEIQRTIELLQFVKPGSKMKLESIEKKIEGERLLAEQQQALKARNEKLKEKKMDSIKSTMEQLKELSKKRKAEEPSEENWTDEQIRKYLRELEREEEEAEEQEKRRIEEEEGATVAAMTSESKKKVYGPAMKPPPRNQKEEQGRDKIKYDNWIAPEGQKGDGYTNLNKKYGY